MLSASRRKSACSAIPVALLLWSCIGGAGCGSNIGGDAREESPPAPGASGRADELIGYPRAGWRLLEEKALDDIVVWSAHILIRHVEADDEVPFSQYEWRTTEPAPARSRAQALTLAQQVAARAAASPGEFAALAAELSEDAPTRSIGGELGGLRAADMAAEPEVLDALTVLRPGDVSRPVETSHGVHVLLRRAPPADEVVAGRRIVVGHVDADWQGPDRPRRTRAEAYQLARQLEERVRARAEELDALARRSSDWHDARGGNDLGSWSVREPSPLAREVAVLQKLAVGEVAAPLEGPLGFEVLLRTESAPRAARRPHTPLELPAFVRPSLEQLLARVPPRVVVQELDAVLESAPFEPVGNPDQRQLLAEVHARAEPALASVLAGPPRAAFADSLTAFLAVDASQQYRALLEERLTSRLLNARVIRYQRKLAR